MPSVALAGYGGQAPLLPSSFITTAISSLPQATPSSALSRANLPQNFYTYQPSTPSQTPQAVTRPNLKAPEWTALSVDLGTRVALAFSKIYNALTIWSPNTGLPNKCHAGATVRRPALHQNAPELLGQSGKHKSHRLDFPHGVDGKPWNKTTFWASGETRPEEWSDDERVMRNVPSYVLEYAPLVHLYSEEEFWPCDIADHLLHTSPYLNYTPLGDVHSRRNLSNLDNLNKYKRDMYLTSDDNVEDRPDWLYGRSNIPDPPIPVADQPQRRSTRAPTQHDRSQHGQIEHGGRSDAPAIMIVVDKGNGMVDAFWWFFYSYNLGNKVLNVRFGNHVGDWEHTLVRFQDGKPDIVFFSEHYDGVGYSYYAVEKIGKRPVVYSARGTHAMYSTPGTQRYVLPWGLLRDETDRGPLWDPLMNSHSYTYNMSTDTFRSSQITPHAPTEWLHFTGHWGDKAYPITDSRQYLFAGQYHYVSGPPGPYEHQLGREKVCQGKGECRIKHWRSEKFEWRLDDEERLEGPEGLPVDFEDDGTM